MSNSKTKDVITVKENMANPNFKSGSTKNIVLPVIIGSVSLVIVIVTLLAKGNLTDDQKYFFKILFAIGCAGVAAAIPGFLSIKYKNIFSAGGALAVFVFVFNNNPVTGSKRFDFTVYLKDTATDQIVAGPDINVNIKLGNDRPAGEWSKKSGGYKFYNIPAEFRGSVVALSINSGVGWVFINSKFSTSVKLLSDNTDVYMVRSCIIKGVVLKDTNLIEGEDSVKVTLQDVEGYTTYTDKTGNFSLNISALNLTAPYTVVFQKGNRSMSYNLDCGIIFKQKLLKSN